MIIKFFDIIKFFIFNKSFGLIILVLLVLLILLFLVGDNNVWLSFGSFLYLINYELSKKFGLNWFRWFGDTNFLVTFLFISTLEIGYKKDTFFFIYWILFFII